MISVPAGSLGELSGFRQAFYSSLTGRADTLFELTDAALCADGPITSLVELSMAAEHRRGHGALYDSLSNGRINIDRLSKVVASQLIPRCTDGRIVLAIDISNWLRPDAATSAGRRNGACSCDRPRSVRPTPLNAAGVPRGARDT